MDISVIIVNWNTGKLLKKCIESIYKKTQGLNFEIIVVDNNSKDKSIEIAKNSEFDFKLIQNKKNRGFAATNNQGVKKARGEYLTLLNPDTKLKNNALSAMVSFLRQNPQIKILGPKILNPDGTIQKSVRAFPKFLDQLSILLKIHHFLPKLRPLKKYFQTDFNYEKSAAVDQVMGAALMIRKNDFDNIGGFDENFYIWFEEVDLSKRIKNNNGKVYYFKDAEITHYGAVSFARRLSFIKQWIFIKSLLYYFKKHHSLLKYLGLLLAAPFGLIFSLLSSIHKKGALFFYFGFSGIAVVSVFLFLFFSQKAGLLFLIFSFIGYLAVKYPRLSTKLLIAFLPFLPILKEADLVPSMTLIKDILIISLFLRLIYKNFQNKRFVFLINTFSILIFLLAAWSIVSLFSADNIITGILRLRDIVLYILAFFVIFDFVKKKQDAKNILAIILITSFFVFALGFVQIAFYQDSMTKRFDPGTNTWHTRVASSFAQPSIFGEYIVIILSLAASFILTIRKKIFFWGLLFILIMSLILLYLTYSRASWVAAAAAIATIFYFMREKIVLRKKLLLTLGIILIFTAYLLMFYTKMPTYLNTLIDAKYKSNADRLYVVYSLVGEGNTATSIFGKGLGDTIVGRQEKKIGLMEIFSFNTIKVKEAKEKTLVDNQYLKTFSEMGIVGIIILFSIFYYLIKTSWKLIRITEDRFLRGAFLGILASIIAFIIQGFGVDIFEIFPTNIIFWIFSGMLMAVYYKKFKLTKGHPERKRRVSFFKKRDSSSPSDLL